MMRYAQVVIYDAPFDMDFTYSIPFELSSLVEKGQVVVVPLRNRDKIGFVVKIDETPYPDAKAIKRVLDIRLPESLLNTTYNLSLFYLSPWSKFLRETVPAELSTLVSRLSWCKDIPKREREKIIDSLPQNAKRQKEILSLLYEKGSLSYNYIKKKLSIPNVSSVIDSLIKKGYIEYLDRELKEIICEYEEDSPPLDDKPLNFEISEGFGIYLLNDLSFSEKVSFYIKLYEKMKSKGSVLFLFPNQKILERVKERFQEAGYEKVVFVYYSGMKKQEERKSWACIKENKKALFLSLAKGPFLPITNLSLILMDEEESLEYITKTDPIYHLRKAVIERAKNEDIPLILEAPKPSLFSYKGLILGEYKKIIFPKEKKRKSKILPNVIILEKENKREEVFNSWLSYRISYMYSQKKKIFIFVNRRGYSSLVCKDCGYIFKCPYCDLPLIYFSDEKELECPRCTYKEKLPDLCPSCGGFNLVTWGEGIEKIKEVVEKLAKDARIVTISSDERPDKFLQPDDYDIIIGTSASFGYFDLSDIDFIGILSIDNMLSSGTYHAAEDTFLFLNYLRINMKKTGEMILETRYPEHRVFASFSKDDPESFYRKEVLYRKELLYPPFSNMVKFIMGAKVKDQAKDKLSTLKEFLKKVVVEEGDFFMDVTGPYFKHKERGYYFWELLFKVENYDLCALLFKGTYLYFSKKFLSKEYKIRVEVDPEIV